MYSQKGEDDIILKYAPPVGKLLDLGAWSYSTFSNSRALIERGWEAVLVEPSSGPFSGLVAEYRHNPKVQLINAMIGTQWRMRDFWVTDDALSTTERKHVDHWGGEKNFTKIRIPEVPVSEICNQHFDFISIDTEKTSVDLLCQMDLAATGTKIVCVEYDDQRQRAAEYLSRYGLLPVWENAANLIAVKE